MKRNSWFRIETAGTVDEISTTIQSNAEESGWKVESYHNAAEMNATHTTVMAQGLESDNAEYEFIILQQDVMSNLDLIPVIVRDVDNKVEILTLEQDILATFSGSDNITDLWDTLMDILKDTSA